MDGDRPRLMVMESPGKSGLIGIVGKPNVGKSTLLNRLLGQKISIVSPRPQTTRSRILGVKTVPQGQMVFVDTPGVYSKGPRSSREVSRVAFEVLQEVDLILWMVEAHADWDEDDCALQQGVESAQRPVFLLVNKIDLSPREMLLPLISRISSLGTFAEIVPISALRAENLDRLEGLILQYLPQGAPLYPSDQITDQSERLLCAEFIREKVFQETQQEIPYVVSVTIEEFSARETQGLVFIDATITVEKPSQKGILIGREGRTLRRIGESARREMESLLGSKVYLRLWVRVREGRTRPREGSKRSQGAYPPMH